MRNGENLQISRNAPVALSLGSYSVGRIHWARNMDDLDVRIGFHKEQQSARNNSNTEWTLAEMFKELKVWKMKEISIGFKI